MPFAVILKQYTQTKKPPLKPLTPQKVDVQNMACRSVKPSVPQ
ncbi:hypothetical protein HMPREF6745_2025 [Prevotella sp. oral taxon 472 str. F0295]|nr:hypothetical protein HMPREF6745_2025 [Prevotella sp. oral taxon 472 str. F0295]